ncbi:MAG TPA: hypothetical protein VGC76_15470 [Pyrinomonadaceae bacterium]|jgi:hypothetical protein
MNRTLHALILICSIFAADAAAQSANKILKQAEKALGGARVWQSLKTSQKKGTITRLKDGASGAFLMQTAAPNFFNESYDLNGFEIESGYNGKSGWMRDSREGLQTLTGKTSADFQAESAFRNNLWLNYKKEKAKIVSCGQTRIGESAANCVNYTTAKGVSIKLYFDAASNLLLREEIPAGDSSKTFDYADYRKIEGVFEPFAVSAKFGEEVYRIQFETVTHNQSIAQTDFDFPNISGEPLPDIQAFLRDLQANEDKIEAILENYSYTQKITARELGDDGRLREKESETYQLSFYKGNRIRRLIEKNGKPLGEKQQADEDEKVQKNLAEVEKRMARKEKDEDENNRRVSIAETLRASLLKNPRREHFRGRDVVVFDFEPNPSFDMKNAKSMLKFFGKVGGVMWIDAQDKQVVRVEASLFDNFKIGGGLLANLKKGATFMMEQERVNEEIWLPSSVDVNMSVKVFLVKGINLNQTVKYYNYRKFTTEVTDTKIDDVKKP